jgi:hypothetical protein
VANPHSACPLAGSGATKPDQREIRLGCPIEEDPADDGGTVRVFLRNISADCLGSDHRHAGIFPQKSRKGVLPAESDPI